jgi:hypothetical protein
MNFNVFFVSVRGGAQFRQPQKTNAAKIQLKVFIYTSAPQVVVVFFVPSFEFEV